MKKLSIIYRYCDKEIPASGLARSSIFGSKYEILKNCLSSLVYTIDSYSILNKKKDVEIEIHFVEDPVKNENIKEIIASNIFRLKSLFIRTHEYKLNISGNAPSIGYTLDLAKSLDTDSIFFCEDDYLFNAHALKLMWEAHEELSTKLNIPVCIHPVDYIDRYTRNPLEPCHILLTQSMHWRTIRQTTGTVMMPKRVLMDNWENISKFRHYQVLPNCDEEHTINTTYHRFPCFSPIPSLAHHVQYKELLSPFFDIKFNRIVLCEK